MTTGWTKSANPWWAANDYSIAGPTKQYSARAQQHETEFRSRSARTQSNKTQSSQHGNFTVKKKIFRHKAILIVLAITFALVSTTASGQVTQSFTEPINQSDVAASESGVIDNIRIVEGQAVRAGEILAQLDHDALKQTLRISVLRSESKSEIRKAESTLRARKARRDTIAPMLKAGHANPTEFEEATVEYEIALSDLEIAREKIAENTLDVDRIKAQIKARTIHSPIDGVVSELHYRLGEYVSGNKPQFATVVQLNQLIVRFYLLEPDVLNLKIGQIVPLNLRTGEQFRQVSGAIKFVSPVTDPDSGTARVDVVIENAHGQYRSGSPCHWIGSGSSVSSNASPL